MNFADIRPATIVKQAPCQLWRPFDTGFATGVRSMFEHTIPAAIASRSALVIVPRAVHEIRGESIPASAVTMLRRTASRARPTRPWVRAQLAVAAAAGCLTCRDTTVTPPPPSDRVVAIAVVPSVADLSPGQTQAFTARSVTAAEDTIPGATVEWRASGGTITQDGVYTAGPDPGDYSVTATKVGGGPLPGRAGVHVFRRVLAMLRVQPDTATLPIEGSWPLSATAYDSAGNALPTAVITWASGNPAIALVDGGGVVTAVAPGAATITASSQGRTDSALIQVVQPGTGPWPNEPSGFRVISDQPWAFLVSLGWSVQFGVGALGTDPTAPLLHPTELRMAYPVGFEGGTAPGTLVHELGGVRQLYGGIRWKVSDPWQGHASSVNKIQYVFTNGHGSMFLGMYGPPGGPHELRAFPVVTTSSDAWLVPHVNHIPVTLGVWHNV